MAPSEGSRLVLGLNGFGRIGRAIMRTVIQGNGAVVGLINERYADDNNLKYLLKYDSTYGRLDEDIAFDGSSWSIGCMTAQRTCRANIDEVPWSDHDVDIVIDASGSGCREEYEKVLSSGIRAVLVTRQFAESDVTVIPGVSPAGLPVSGVVSTSTCDGNALALVMNQLRNFGIAAGSVTTLHPWLSDQALLDRPASSPGVSNYGLGRNATTNIIPKETSAAEAAAKVIPEASRLCAISFRVPTQNVSCLDLTLHLAETDGKLSVTALNDTFAQAAHEGAPLQFTADPLVSGDFSGANAGAIVDGRWTRQVADDWFKVVAWYDNEVGYANQVLRAAQYGAALRQE